MPTVPRLSRALAQQSNVTVVRPERVLQYGEGVFLRAFVDDAFDEMNKRGLFNGLVVIVKPIPAESPVLCALNDQDGLYTLRLRGNADGAEFNRTKIVSAVSRAIDPYTDYAAYMDCAANPDLRYIVSNTTEAGIVYDPDDRFTFTPPRSYPGKLTAFLHARWKAFEGDMSKGCIILPCELIDDNATMLKKIVMRLCAEWELPDAFTAWVETANHFCNTLVDRIVTGFPKDDIHAFTAELGYDDQAFDTAEAFGLWVIESTRAIEELPFEQIDGPLHTVWTDDVRPYKMQKVRLLNGAHTISVPAGLLCGMEYVTDMLKDGVFLHYIQQGLRTEIIPATACDGNNMPAAADETRLPEERLTAFADAVLERFANPHIRHRLENIALNSISKWKTRVLPSITDYYERFDKAPRLLTFSLAALTAFYGNRGNAGDSGVQNDSVSKPAYTIIDDESVLSFFQSVWASFNGSESDAFVLMKQVCSNAALWGRDLQQWPGFTETAAAFLWDIVENGARDAMNRLFLKQIDPADNVAVTLCDIPIHGTCVPAGHKLATRDLTAGETIIKYGFPIGIATVDIKKGEHIHLHNLRSALTAGNNTVGKSVHRPPNASAGAISGIPAKTGTASLCFMGYPRANGRVGIRNEIWIIGTVGCVNGIAIQIAAEANRRALVPDGVHIISHPYGCSQMGDDQENTRRIIARLAQHPNAGGVLMLGLGCENNHLGIMRTYIGEVNPERCKFLNLQESDDEVGDALAMLESLADVMRTDKRVETPLSKLVIGLKCGGSDGFSGITANPLLGRLSDRLVGSGGTALLTEVPEMFGAEGLLFDRCASPAIRADVVRLIEDFKQYFANNGQPIDQNPSPGNNDGGITTLAEKSLGCTQKGGAGVITAVIPYGGQTDTAGLNLLEAPGNDLVAVTALAAAGAVLTFFTTGRGTPLGSPVPVLKISTNTVLAKKKPQWIDMDAGPLINGADMASMTDDLLALTLLVASGEQQTRSEMNQIRDVAIWKNGVTL